MKTCMLVVLWGALSTTALAKGMTAKQAECYSQIKQEAAFIVSRINLIQRDYEGRVKHSALGVFHSGGYSTRKLLDNTIRQYHRKLVHRIENYPIRYAARLGQGRHATCQASNLQDESVGTIHKFELSWQKALSQARKNARYFSQLNKMR